MYTIKKYFKLAILNLILTSSLINLNASAIIFDEGKVFVN